MLLDRHHFHFFGSKEINSLYLTLGLLYFGEGLISVFVPIYFWQLGFPLWRILFFYFLGSLFFIALAFLFLPIIRKLSDKMMIFLSIPFTVFYFYGLSFLGDVPVLFYVLPLLTAFHYLFFNIGYHVSFSSAADDGYVGREVGMRYMIGAFAQFPAPFIGGLLIGFLGFQYTFTIVTVILFLAVLPIFFFPRRHFSSNLNIKSTLAYLKNKQLRPFNISGFGYATETMVARIIWPLFIFISIGSIQQFGGVISLGLLAGIIVTFLAGFLSDIGRRRKVITWASSLFSLIWILRTLFVKVFAIVGSHIAGIMVSASLMVSWSSQYYKIARAVPEPSIFILSREMLYNFSRILFIPPLMLLAYILPSHPFFIVSFLVAAGLTPLFLFANKFHTRDAKNL